MKLRFLLLIPLLSAAASSGARATVIMDQIGSNPSFFEGDPAYTPQQFESTFGNGAFDSSVVDNFSATSSTLMIDNVQAVMAGLSGFNSFSLVIGYYVQIYSSASAANANLTGDVASVFVPSALAMVTQPYNSSSGSGLVSLDVSILLPGAGNYYIAVIAENYAQVNGQIGVYCTAGLPGSLPGGQDALLENPGGGNMYPGNVAPIGDDAAYRINAVPEPSTWTMLAIGGTTLLGGLRVRARRS